jgi:Tol biopolymer transport system component
LAETDASSIDAHGWSLSPDGGSIAYVNSPDLRSQTIRILRLDTGKISNLSIKDFVPGQIAWSRDGTVLFATGGTTQGFGWELVGVRRDGQFRILDQNSRGIWFPSLSPDGKKLAFAKDADDINVAVLENF